MTFLPKPKVFMEIWKEILANLEDFAEILCAVEIKGFRVQPTPHKRNVIISNLVCIGRK